MNFKQAADQALLDRELGQLQQELTAKNQLQAAGDRVNQLATELEQLLLSLHRAGLEANHKYESRTPNNNLMAPDLMLPRFAIEGSGSTVTNRPIDLSGYREAAPLAELLETDDSPVQREKDALKMQVFKLNAELAEAEMQARAYLTGRKGETSAQAVTTAVQSKKSELAKASMRLQELEAR